MQVEKIEFVNVKSYLATPLEGILMSSLAIDSLSFACNFSSLAKTSKQNIWIASPPFCLVLTLAFTQLLMAG